MAETVGLIGLGNMGVPMALNLMRGGYEVRVYNRTAAKSQPLIEQGAKLAAQASDVAVRGGVVFSIVADDHALEEVCMARPSFVERLGQGGVHVSMSTISPAISRRLAWHHSQHGVTYVAAPVFGRPDAAAAKKLWVCLSGPTAAKKRIEPMLAAMGQGNFDFGEDPGAANVAKLCGNFLIAAAIEALGETLALAEKNGLDRMSVVNMLTHTLFACRAYEGYGKLIAENKFEPPGFRLVMGLKDVNLVSQTAEASRVPMPIASLVRDRFLASLAKGHAEIDWAGISLNASEDAGIETVINNAGPQGH
jgi:3-hydroxyisobutyrate dehydrogenase-like beta-hydroxyacid dehydrogenase